MLRPRHRYLFIILLVDFPNIFLLQLFTEHLSGYYSSIIIISLERLYCFLLYCLESNKQTCPCQRAAKIQQNKKKESR